MLLNTTTISEITILNKHSSRPTIKLVLDAVLEHKPGQYITLVAHVNGTEVRRSYSLASNPGHNVTLYIKREPNGILSNWLMDHATVGMQIQFVRPSGNFLLPEPQNAHHLVFLGAGSGLTPLWPMLQQALNAQAKSMAPRPITWLAIDPKPEESLFFEEIRELLSNPDYILDTHYIFSRSEPEDLSHYATVPNMYISTGHLGNLAFETWVKEQIPHPSEAHYMLCGPEALMRMQRFELRLLGVHPENIHQEHFSIAKPEPTQQHYPDVEVTVSNQGQSVAFEATGRNTIWQAAKAAGITLPHSCLAGMCAACVARVKKGSVEMTTNQVLTDADVSSGLVLTCTAHALEPTTLEFGA